MKRKTLVNVVGVLLAFLLGALVLVVQGYNPLETYFRLFEYSLAPGKLAYTLSKSVPLVLTWVKVKYASWLASNDVGFHVFVPEERTCT